MFLDDQLIEICLKAEIDEPDDVQATYTKLIDRCQDYYKNQVKPNMRREEVKTILDRTFKLWDSFVRTALTHSNNQVKILGALCKKYTFKDAFMGDAKLSSLYNTL